MILYRATMINKFYNLLSLLLISFSATASEEWLYYKHYPWIYDHKTEDWLYLNAGNDNKIYAYRNSTQKWEEFSESLLNINSPKNWDMQYEEWIQNPRPYGGLLNLESIKRAKDDGSIKLDLSFDSSLKQTATSLGLSYNVITNVTPLSELTNLTELSLDGNSIIDLMPLSELSNLNKLSIFDNNISDLSSIRGLTNLQNLKLSGNINISDLSPLGNLTNLEELWLGQFNSGQKPSENTRISDLTPLSGLKGLVILSLGYSSISDLSPLAGLTNLKDLWLDGNSLKDLSPLSGLTNLQNLYLSDNNITNLSPLAELTNLTFLGLVDNNITASQKAMLEAALPNTNISWPIEIIDDPDTSQKQEKTWDEKYSDWLLDPSPYGGLEVLQKIKEAKDNGSTTLDLLNSNITDISPIEDLTSLVTLALDANNISNLSPLQNLTNLTNLILDGNNITDLEPISNLVNLESLELADNNISDVTPLLTLTNLNYLGLSYNFISDEQKLLLEASLPNTTINLPADYNNLFTDWDQLRADFPYTVEITQDDVKDASSGRTQKTDNEISFEFFPVGSKIGHFGASGGSAGATTVYLDTEAIAVIYINGSIVNSNIRYITPTGIVYEGTIIVGGTTVLTEVDE